MALFEQLFLVDDVREKVMSLKLGPNKGKEERIRKQERKDQACLLLF